jgi:tRNA G18 (ribose-2'-O)-methylase SpoU
MEFAQNMRLYIAEKGPLKRNEDGLILNGGVGLVLGSESQGLQDLPQSIRDSSTPISINTSPDMPYLGVSAAGAILMNRLGTS